MIKVGDIAEFNNLNYNFIVKITNIDKNNKTCDGKVLKLLKTNLGSKVVNGMYLRDLKLINKGIAYDAKNIPRNI